MQLKVARVSSRGDTIVASVDRGDCNIYARCRERLHGVHCEFARHGTRAFARLHRARTRRIGSHRVASGRIGSHRVASGPRRRSRSARCDVCASAARALVANVAAMRRRARDGRGAAHCLLRSWTPRASPERRALAPHARPVRGAATGNGRGSRFSNQLDRADRFSGFPRVRASLPSSWELHNAESCI